MESIQPTRIQVLQATARNRRGRHVVYWMQQSQRAHWNHALEYAVGKANRGKQPLLVLFVLTDAYPEANARHYAFMLEGLREVRDRLADRGIAFRVEGGDPVREVLTAAAQASTLICDRGYLRHQILWRQRLAFEAPCPVVQVESDAVIPIQTVSAKSEYAARTIRPKIHRLLPQYLQPVAMRDLKCSDMGLSGSVSCDALFSALSVDRSVKPASPLFHGGRKAALARFKKFMTQGLPVYHRQRNHPESDKTSMMSPYLHFGQISSLEMALAVEKSDICPEAKSSLLEELIVRRELAMNFAYYNPDYDRFTGLPQWARRTLAEHSHDTRAPRYTSERLDSAATHDPYWNAAMTEMKHTGYMHTYMRMYWGKKILQWSASPQDAFYLTLKMNNKYFIDGRDPNAYAGVGWIYGLHDQAWKERPIFGKIRYMARSGLERKFDMSGYVTRVKRRVKAIEKAMK